MLQKLCIQSSLFMCSILRNNVSCWVCEMLYYYLSIKLIKCMGLDDCMCRSASLEPFYFAEAKLWWLQSENVFSQLCWVAHALTHKLCHLSVVKRLTLNGNWLFSHISRKPLKYVKKVFTLSWGSFDTYTYVYITYTPYNSQRKRLQTAPQIQWKC